MDREVSAGFYDHMMPDTDFEFANYTRNIPRGSTSMLDTLRTSNIESSLYESINDSGMQWRLEQSTSHYSG